VAAPYQLVCAVQDLYDLYLRLAPTGPYRLPLFAGAAAPAPVLPAGMREQALRLDALARGVTCLLANKLPLAALPVAAEMWRGVQLLERTLAPSAGVPQYYAYLTRELAQAEDDAERQAYRLFGEVLAVYLDVLRLAGLPGAAGGTAAVQHLRCLIAQAGGGASPAGPDSGAPAAGS
jgi:hypothetical protein